jgi:flavin-dependent dehydrogenase
MTLAPASGVEVLVVDRASFPRRKACGSGLSPWAIELLDRLGVWARVRREANPIRAALIGGRSGRPVELRGRMEAAVLLRERLDDLLVDEARARGARLVEGVLVRSVIRDRGRPVAVETSVGSIEADAVIDCSGANTRLSRIGRGRTMHTIMGWYAGVPAAADTVELYFDEAVRPHYGWVFPESDDRVNIGICYLPGAGEPKVRERFDAFLERRLSSRLEGATQLGALIGHPIATSARPFGLVKGGVLTAGEAGSLVDPATAEGIHQALASGRLAGGILRRLLEDGLLPSDETLAPYTRAVRKEVGRRLIAGQLLLELLRTPVFDFVLRFGARRSVRAGLARVLAGA